MRAVWGVLRGHRDLRLVLSAGLVSLTGDWVLRIGLVYRVYAMTGSTVAPALTMVASFAPQVVLGPVAGVFADRWDRKKTMIVSNVLLAGGLLPLLLVHRGNDLWVVFAVMLWEGAVQQFFATAEQAMLPRLVSDEHLISANALNGQNRDLARLAGSALGGVIAATGGIAAVALADASTFGLAAALIAFVRADGSATAASAASAASGASGASGAAPAEGVHRARTGRVGRIASVGQELRGGIRMTILHPVLRPLMIFVLVTGTGEGIFSALFAPFVRHVLHGSSQAYGVVAAAQAVGGIAGGLIAASLGQRIRASRVLGAAATAFGLIDLAIFLYPLGYAKVWPAVIGMVIVGLPAALTIAGLITLFQRNTSDSYRGRVFGAGSALEGITILAGTVAAGYLGQVAGIIPVLAFQGGAYVLAGAGLLVLRGEVPRRGPAAPTAAVGHEMPARG